MTSTASRVLITGASRGLGLATAEILAAKGAPLLLACRDGTSPLAGPNVEVMQLDVSDLDAVRAFSERLAGERFRTIICNAGLQFAGEARHTPAGLERTFATNHLGHYLLLRLTRAERVILVASNTHDPTQRTGMPAPDLGDIETIARGSSQLDGRVRYTTSKLYNVVTAYELSRRQSDAAVFAFDPGMMPGTALARDYGALARFAWSGLLPALTLFAPNVNTVCTSSRRLARLALGELDAPPGSYVSRGRALPSSVASHDADLGAQLWSTSARLVGLAQ